MNIYFFEGDGQKSLLRPIMFLCDLENEVWKNNKSRSQTPVNVNIDECVVSSAMVVVGSG